MRQANRIISTYTADVMGISSALYELGGLIVVHDPSGCNSTYATHDEPRWFSMPSHVYISALEQFDALLGKDEKLISDIVETAEQLNPRFIAISGTIVPSMLGTDFKAVAKIVEARTNIPTFGFSTNSMHSYVLGADMAMARFAEHFCVPCETENKTINILGVTPLDFSITGNVALLKNLFENNGYAVNAVWTMESSFEELSQSAKADCNVVVSSCGLGTAKILQKKFNIPYVVGCPIGVGFTKDILYAMENKTSVEVPEVGESDNYIIGEAITASSLRAALKKDFNINANVICPTESDGEVLAKNDLLSSYEEDIEARLKKAKLVIADPMYKPIIPENAKFIPFPHEACSGRIYRKDIPMFIGEVFDRWMQSLHF